jgi:hypothetical protein
MQSVRKAVFAGCVTAILVLTSCTTPFSTYSRYMFEGRRYWEVKEYGPARKSFVSAYEAQKEVTALSWAATTSYWLNDLASAERYIQEAEMMPTLKTSVSWFRVKGYKALILFKQGKKAEGFDVLKEYVYAYGYTYPSTNLPLIDLMVRKGEADLPRLQAMLEEDVYAYEEEMGLFTSAGVGYYNRNYGAAGGNGGSPSQ